MKINQRSARRPIQTLVLTSISDDFGGPSVLVANGGRIQDDTPTLTGRISAPLNPGESIRIFHRARLLGSAMVDRATLRWRATPKLPSPGTYHISARVLNSTGQLGPASASWRLVLDHDVPRQRVTILSLIDELGLVQGPVAEASLTNDTTPTLTGTLSAPLRRSENLIVYLNGAVAGSARVRGISWRYTPTTPLGDNGLYRFSAAVVNAAGTRGRMSSVRRFTLDSTAPSQAVTILDVLDDNDTLQGAVGAGGLTNDSTPKIIGTVSAPLAADEMVTIYSNGLAIGTATVDETAIGAGDSRSRTWTFTPTLTVDGSHTFTAAVQDRVGNQGPVSAPSTIQLAANRSDGRTWRYVWSNTSSLPGVPGVLHASVQVNTHRIGEPPLRVSALRVDLTTPGLSLTSTAPIADWQANVRETATQTTRDFITGSRRQGTPVVAAVNTSFFNLIDPTRSLPTTLQGLAVSEQRLVSPTEAYHPYFVLDAITGARIERDPAIAPNISTTKVAFAGMSNGVVLWDDIPSWPPEQNSDLNARSALGLSRDSRYLVLMTIDRSLRSFAPSYWGATFNELGMFLAGFGASTGLNLDGGGSTQMAWWDPASGSAQLLNAPLFGQERAVGNNLGIIYQPLT